MISDHQLEQELFHTQQMYFWPQEGVDPKVQVIKELLTCKKCSRLPLNILTCDKCQSVLCLPCIRAIELEEKINCPSCKANPELLFAPLKNLQLLSMLQNISEAHSCNVIFSNNDHTIDANQTLRHDMNNMDQSNVFSIRSMSGDSHMAASGNPVDARDAAANEKAKSILIEPME